MTLSPPWADPFVAREQVLRDLAAWLQRCRERGVPCRMYVHGLEGLGVSCLVTKFAKDYRQLIDGPMIWLSGRRPDGQAVPAGELVAQTLRALGVAEADQGNTDADRVSAYQRISRGKTFMIVVDDLVNPGQVKDLVPHDAPRTIVVATTPFERRSLDREGFTAFTPEFLAAEDARILFRDVAGETVDELPESTVQALVEACGGIPLLVKVLAAQVRGRADRVAQRLLTRLRTSKLNLLAWDDERRMARFLDTTYDSLAPELARTYRGLSLLPGAEFSVAAAAASLGLDADDTAMALETLVEFHLLTVAGTDRYAFHPVLREDARVRTQRDDELSLRAAVTERGLRWYLREALPRGAAVSNRWWVDPVTTLMNQCYDGAVPRFSRTEALAWFATEAANLIAAVRAAHHDGLPDVAWPLCVALWKYLHLAKLYDAWIDTHRDGLAAARAAGDLAGVLQLTSQLGAAYLEVGEYVEARRCFEESLAAARKLRHALGEQSALEWLGKIAAAEHRFHVALELYQQSWDVTVRASDADIDPRDKERVFALLRLQQARARIGLGDWAQALATATPAQDYFDAHTNETDNSAKIRLVAGQALLGAADAASAVPLFTEAVTLFHGDDPDRLRRGGAGRAEADAQWKLGQALVAAGRHADATQPYRIALAYYRGVGNPLADTIATALSELTG